MYIIIISCTCTCTCECIIHSHVHHVYTCTCVCVFMTHRLYHCIILSKPQSLSQELLVIEVHAFHSLLVTNKYQTHCVTPTSCDAVHSIIV